MNRIEPENGLHEAFMTMLFITQTQNLEKAAKMAAGDPP
jgi:hypothetical protein